MAEENSRGQPPENGPFPEWPKPGDSLFKQPNYTGSTSANPRSFNAWINELYLELEYRRGAFNASRILAVAIKQSDWPGPSTEGIWVPMVFQFRHFVELSLKLLLLGASRQAGHSSDETVRALAMTARAVAHLRHDLKKLWDHLDALLRSLYPSEKFDDSHDAVARLVMELHDWDKASTRFRYPTDQDGKVHPDASIPTVDLGSWLGVTQRMRNYFEGWEALLEVDAELLSDLLSDLMGDGIPPDPC